MKQRSIIGSLARRMALGMLCLWLAVAALLTTLVAGDIRAQSAPVYAEALERAMEELRSRSGEEGLTAEKLDFSLPECAFVPAGSLPLTRQRQIPLWKGTLALIPRGNIMKGEGFDLTGAVMGNVGLTIVEGKLAIGNNVGDVGNSSGNMTNSSQKGFFLTFWQDPLRKGSFPSREFSGDYEGEKPRAAFPVVVTAPARMTPEELMDGLDSGSWHFDSMRLRQCSCLRGCWLTDGAGEPCCFAVGAYGWSPLLEAIRAMGLLYMLSFLFFQLVGAALWLSMRRSMVHPLGKLERALGAEPLQVSSAEYDYLLPYGELRGPVAAYLLRRQMQYAAAVTPGTARPPEECPLLLTELQRCEDKLLPILTDRGQRINRELKADGRVSADRTQLEDALLALFRETVDFAEENEEMCIRTAEKADFLLAEIEVRTKRHLKEMEYQRLWDGIYRSPADGDAPGAKLRKAMWRLPGSFAAVRKTKKGLALTLGLPKKS